MHFYQFRRMIRKLPGEVIHEIPIPTPALTQGFGTRAQLGAVCRRMQLRSVLLVTDQTVFSLGYHEKIVAALEDNGIRCTVFHDIDSEPTVDIIRAGRDAVVACRADGIVALGGGSVLDSCKIIAACARHPERDLHRYLLKFAYVRGGTLPLLMVPTTAGTGAEHTVGAVVKNAHGVKHSTVIVGLNVKRVVLDSELMVNAPTGVTVWCGIDALSHGLEGLLSDTHSSAQDVEKSRACVRLVLENLPVLLEDPQNVEARQSMSLAAYYGGNAINKQLAGYVHAFAHSIGALYHIPHGKAIAWSLLPVLTLQKEACLEPLAALSVYCGCAAEDDPPEDAADRLLEALRQLLERCGLEKGCPALVVQDEARLVQMIDADSINYSPAKTLSDREIRQLLAEIREGA